MIDKIKQNYLITDIECEFINELTCSVEDVANKVRDIILEEDVNQVFVWQLVSIAFKDDILRDAVEHCVEPSIAGAPLPETDTSEGNAQNLCKHCFYEFTCSGNVGVVQKCNCFVRSQPRSI